MNENIKLHNGNCLDIMKEIPDKSIDLILCDLPYGVTWAKWDSTISFEDLWKEYNRICKGNIILFSSQPFTTDLINSNREMFKYCLVWNKNVPTGMSSAKYRPMKYHEDICVFYKGKQMITKEEAIALISKEFIILTSYGSPKTVVLLTDVYEIIDKIFEELTIKDSFNNK